jgi:hypothetical protein
MPLVLRDRVKETSATTGTGTLTLSGAATGFQSFAVIGNGNTTYYAIYDRTNQGWEIGVGTYSSNTLTRDTVLESSNSGSKVNFPAGTKDVFCTYPAEQAVTLTDIQTLTNKTITGGTVNPTTLQENSVNVVVQTDVGTAPNEIPLNQYLGNLAFQSSNAVVINPVASATPVGIGDMVFQLTSDTSLEIKVKGSDGTVRSVALTLA